MRLIILNQFYHPDISPTASLAATLANHRASLGDEVTVVCGQGSYIAAERAADRDRPAGVNIRRVWTPNLGKRSNLRRVIDYAAFYASAAAILTTMRPQDMIVTLTTPPMVPFLAALHKRIHRRTRLVLWNMDCYPDLAERGGVMKPGGFAARTCHAINRSVFKRLDHLVCLDSAMARLLCAHYARVRPGLPVSIIPNWEEAAFFPPGAQHGPWSKWSELGLDGKFVVLYLGNMGYGHDFATVLDAAESLRDTTVRFLFVGGGKRYAEVEREVQRRGLTNIVLHGYVPKDDTPRVMTQAHAALVTLRDDIIGIMSPSKIHANLAMGLPLIYVGPTGSNVDEAVEQHDCGISLRHGQSRELADFVRSLASDAAAAAELRRRARRAFDASYCDTVAMPRFDALIRDTLAGAQPDRTARDYDRPLAAGTA